MALLALLKKRSLVPGSSSMPVLACPGTPGFEFSSFHSLGYGIQSNTASIHTRATPSSGMLAPIAGLALR
jgi:hypothetical protein